VITRPEHLPPPRTVELRGLVQTLRFAGIAFAGILTPSSYSRASFAVIQKQIYYTAWEILPAYIAIITLLSVVIITIVGETARDFNLYGYVLETVIRVIVLEIVPLATALLVAIRTGAAINTEVALMKLNSELEALEMVRVDPMRFELLPRVAGGTVAVVALTALGVLISLALSHLIIVNFQPWNLPPGDFRQTIGQVLSPEALLILWGKSLAFGLSITIISIAEGLETPKRIAYAPVAVLSGMLRLFLAIMLIETGALVLTYVY
jgi:phospholipid/cholesterol/gamma-HCH transport system permease protein